MERPIAPDFISATPPFFVCLLRKKMDSKDFVRVIKKVVRDAAIEDCLEMLEQPPGRRPSQHLRERAEWYKSLNLDERRYLADVVSSAVDGAVFGFLCVLDGVRVVESGDRQGTFELRYVKKEATILVGEDLEMLHDLYKLAD